MLLMYFVSFISLDHKGFSVRKIHIFVGAVSHFSVMIQFYIQRYNKATL